MKIVNILLYLFFQVSFANEIKIGDSFYKQREKLSNVYLALENYEKFLTKNNIKTKKKLTSTNNLLIILSQ